MSEYFCEAAIDMNNVDGVASITLCGQPATLRANKNPETFDIVPEVALCDAHADETVQGGLHG